ncbi:MAG: hypothetical protein IAE79_09835, partial [Anaerolinea sp.]|nr:hypothetical protein [Anaerolinea sp.]
MYLLNTAGRLHVCPAARVAQVWRRSWGLNSHTPRMPRPRIFTRAPMSRTGITWSVSSPFFRLPRSSGPAAPYETAVMIHTYLK